MATKKPSLIQARVRELGDTELRQLVVELSFSTKLEQATLHYARNEQRRRSRAAKKASS